MLEGLDLTIIRSSDLSAPGTNKRIDAEFFSKHFVANQLMLRRCPMPKESLSGVTSTIDVGHVGPMADEYLEEGVPLLLTQNVGQFRVDYANCVRVSEAFHQKLSKSQIFPGDCLIARSGTIGNTAFVLDIDPQPLNSADIIIVRADSEKVTNGFLAAFLNSPAGALQIERLTSGGLQGHINLRSIAHLAVPLPSHNFQDRIQSVVRGGMLGFYEAEKILARAEQTLLGALDLEGWKPPEPLTYTRRASDAFAAGRLDSDFFAPARYATMEKLAAMPHRLLSDCCDPVRDLFDPTDPEGVEQVRNFDVSAALKPALDDSTPPVPVEEIGSTKKKMKNGDVVISRLRSYLRQIAVVRTSDTIPTVGSSEFIVLRPRPGISPELLMVFLRSRPVQTILKYCQEGNQHPRFGESNLLEIPFPNVLMKQSEAIISQINQAHQARQEAQHLLAKAKRAVEVAIEESEAAAMRLLATP